MKKLTILISASFLALNVSGCALTTAGVKKGDERNFARSLNDVNAARAIKARMGRVQGFNLKGVDVEVAEGIVLLSGNVPRQEDRIEAERIAWSAPRIDEVGNEILLKDKQGKVRNVKDGILNNSVRARLIANKSVKARNYNIEVHDGIVYLMGVARSPDELALAAHTASTTKGTREVISYVKVAGDTGYQSANRPSYQPQTDSMAYAPASPSYSNPNTDYAAPMPMTSMPAPSQGGSLPPLPNTEVPMLDSDALDSGEPYYLDPQTGERINLPEGVKPIPYVPDQGPGSLGAGGTPLPPGAKPSQMLNGQSGALPSDDYLGAYRSRNPGQAVSVTETPPYTLDPQTGEMVPVSWDGSNWVQIIR